MTSIIEVTGEMAGQRRHLTILQLIFLNAVVCGTEFCACAGFTYIPPILLKAGFAEQNMSILMGLGPLLGMFTVPVIGRWSDRCNSRFGRRRPFIFGISIIIIFSLLLVPYGDTITTYLFGTTATSKLISTTLLAAGVILLDFATQALFNPCEAMLTDACKNTSQNEQCFQVYSVMVSIGGCVGYLITALDWNTMSVGILFGSQEKSAFSLLVLFFTITLIITLTVVEEIPYLENGQADDSLIPSSTTLDPGYETETSSEGNDDVQSDLKDYEDNVVVCSTPTKRPLRKQSSFSKAQNLFSAQFRRILQFQVSKFFKCQGIIKSLRTKIYQRLPYFIQSYLDLPYVLKNLACTDFFGWTAIFSFNLFYSDYVGQYVYKGNPNGAESSMELLLYDEGVRMGSWGLFLHCITSGVFAAVIDRFTDKYGFRKVLLYGMMSFTAAMVLMLFVGDSIVLVTIMACLTGFGYATLTTLPYSLVTLYIEDPQLFFYENYLEPDRSPKQSLGAGGNLAILDSAYFLSQVVLTAFMGYLVHFTGSVRTYIVCAVIFGVFGCLSIKNSIFTRQEMLHHIRNQRRVQVEQNC